jgi:signal transduction histidine kinase
LVVVRASSPPEFDTAVLGANLVFGLGVLYFGWTVQVRRRQAALLEERNRELGVAREQLAVQVVSAERLRLARELHDVVAHSMSVIAVQAGAGRHVLRTDPDEAEFALGAIEATSRDALAEMRRMVGVLRHDGQRVDVPETVRGVADIAGLVEEIGKAGLPTSLAVEGERPITYRIVQEALTNAIKYAGPARAVVRICWRTDAVVVEVCDDGVGAAVAPERERTNGSGHGVAGMRERVALLGGDLTAAPTPGGGFRVAAHLPLTSPDDVR